VLLGVETTTEFNIFENPADCLDTVIKLGNDYNTSIESFDDEGNWCCVVYNFLHIRDNGLPFCTYQEAVAAAVLHIIAVHESEQIDD